MFRAEGVDLKWHEIGYACKAYGFAYGAGFLVLAILNSRPEFKQVAQVSPWISRYVGDALAFAVTMLLIWRESQGNLRRFGFTLGPVRLQLRQSALVATALGLLWILLERALPTLAGAYEPQAAYPRTVANLVGMMSFQWVFVGVFEEPLARGLVQTHLMERLSGVVHVLRWDLHVGTVLAGVIFGIGHAVPHLFFGGSWTSMGSHLAFATLFGLLAGYVYQETRSLAGPVLMHNIVDGLLATAALMH
jgi:membrane protease YdiL (CAAX protease family)